MCPGRRDQWIHAEEAANSPYNLRNPHYRSIIDFVLPRPTLLGICSIAIVVLVILIPERPSLADWAIVENRGQLADQLRQWRKSTDDGRLARDAARGLLNNGHGEVAEGVVHTTLKRKLVRHEWAALLTLSEIDLGRNDFESAHAHSTKALKSCRKDSLCSSAQAIRIQVFARRLRAGIDSGINPKENPNEFIKAVEKIKPLRTTQPAPSDP